MPAHDHSVPHCKQHVRCEILTSFQHPAANMQNINASMKCINCCATGSGRKEVLHLFQPPRAD